MYNNVLRLHDHAISYKSTELVTMKKIILALIICLPLAGCITQQLRHDEVINKHEGVFVTKLSCGNGIQFVNVYASGNEPKHTGLNALSSTSAGNRVESLICDNDNYKVMKLPEGEYFIGRLVNAAAAQDIKEKDALKFTVYKNKVNYIGDVFYKTWVERRGHTVTTGVTSVDISQNPEIKEILDTDFSALLSKYELVQHSIKR